MEIPSFDINSIISMIMPLVRSVFNGISGIANSIGSMIFPSNPGLALIVIAVIAAYLLKDKLSGGLMFIILAILMYLIMSGSIVL